MGEVSRADSPLRDRMIFCFGARRSGTFLMQRLISAHSDVSAVPSESHLISHGIAPLLERFHHGVKGSTQVGSMYADREGLLDAVRDFCDNAFAEFREPGTSHVIERTPLHATTAGLIADLYPDAGVVHCIRDGRDVARSISRQTWWGPDSIADAAREWAECVRGGREASGLERYVEVRYEDLLADPAPTMKVVFERLGLDASASAVEPTLAELNVPRNVEPGDEIGTNKWRKSFSRADLRAFDRAAGPMLRELGYEPASIGSDGETTLPETRPGSSRSIVARLARGTRRLARSRKSRRKAAEAHVVEVVQATETLDRLLTAASEGREDAVLELLDPSPEAIFVTPDGTVRREKGETTRQLLAQALVGDQTLRGRQIAGEVLAGHPTTTGALVMELPDGTREKRVVSVDVRNRLVKRAMVEVSEQPD